MQAGKQALRGNSVGAMPFKGLFRSESFVTLLLVVISDCDLSDIWTFTVHGQEPITTGLQSSSQTTSSHQSNHNPSLS